MPEQSITPGAPQEAPQAVPVVAPAVVAAAQPTAPTPAVQSPAPAPTVASAVPQKTAPPQAPTAQKTVAPQSNIQSRVAAQVKGSDQGARNKKFVLGCCAFGLFMVFAFVGLIFLFLGVGGTTENPIFAQFGVSGGEVVNILIVLINLLFGITTFVAFVISIIGLFKVFTTKKADTVNRRKGMFLGFISFALMVLLIFMWIFAFLYLDSKQTVAPEDYIITEPAETIGLTAPVTISFDGSQVPINRNRYEVLTYIWNFADGEEATGVTQTHTYRSKGGNAGRFEVVLRVTARDKATSKEVEQEYSKLITIANEAAQAVIKAKPETGEIPLKVSFDASNSSDPDGEIQKFEWDFDNNGTFDAEGEKTEHTFEQIGTYTVVLRMRESTGTFSLAEQEITVTPSNEPVVLIGVEGVSGTLLTTGVEYTFSGAESTSPSGRIESYTWDFGDDTPVKTTRTTTHTYAKTGTYEVVLTVRDNTGRSAEGSKMFTVANAESVPVAMITTNPPAVSKDAGLKGTAPFAVEFDGSASTDADNNIVEYTWDFDNDNTADATDITTTHTYESAGTYTAELTVTDAVGNENKQTLFITVTAPGLNAEVTGSPTDGEVPLTVTFDASGSSYPGHRITGYEWDFGDSSEPRLDAAKISHNYKQIGSFTVTVTAVGDDGEKSETQTIIQVRPIAIRACFAMKPEEGAVPLEVLFDPGCSTGTISNYKWNFGAAGTSRDRKPIVKFEKAGTYEVTLEVSDNQNTIDTFKKSITVTATE